MPKRKLPAIQFYPGDWLRDEVAGCSLAAQGLWLRLIFVMHDSERYGYLSTDGSPIRPDALARRCGCSLGQYETLFAELARAGVPSVAPDGVYYCRRMVEEDRRRQGVRARVQKHRMKRPEQTEAAFVKRSCNADVTPMKRECNIPSSSSSSSSEETSAYAEGLFAADEPRPKRTRARDPTWDMLVECFYEPKTAADKKRFGQVVRDLKMKAATPQGIRQTFERCKEAFTGDGKPFGLECVVKWYEQFTSAQARPKRKGRVEAPPGKYARFRAPTTASPKGGRDNGSSSDAELDTENSR